MTAEETFTALYERHLPMVRRLALAQLRDCDRGLVDDMAQEAFLRLWASIAAGAEIRRPAALLALITRHVVIDHYRVGRNRCERVGGACDLADAMAERRLPASPAAGDVAETLIEVRAQLAHIARCAPWYRDHVRARRDRLAGLAVAA